MKENDIVHFLREKDYIFVEDIGQGACGRTVLLRDDLINEDFVCKKYQTYDPENQYEYFNNFKNEIKLLHLLYHKNIVRIFNYHLYPKNYTGYIIMEYVKGTNINDYIKNNPEKINDIFVQVLEGFKYLEDNKILHRDIRNNNILVTLDGSVKIIDFGFGKKIEFSEDDKKSITLNWIAESPSEFYNNKYDNKTELYFIGKLFEKIIIDNDIQNFLYKDILKLMIVNNYDERIESFNSILKTISKIQFESPDKFENTEELFSEADIIIYRKFANYLCYSIYSIENSTTFIDDVDRVLKNLNEAITNCILEEYIPTEKIIINCFLIGEYGIDDRYTENLKVSELKDFRNMLMNSSIVKKKIILRNIQTKLDAIERYTNPKYDDLPF